MFQVQMIQRHPLLEKTNFQLQVAKSLKHDQINEVYAFQMKEHKYSLLPSYNIQVLRLSLSQIGKPLQYVEELFKT